MNKAKDTSSKKTPVFKPHEKKILNGLSTTLALRQLGMLLVLPFLSTWGATLQDSTPALLGMAMGIYGLTQGLFQIPYGLWSDRTGRKRPIVIGLTVFTIGLFLASFSSNIHILIAARALQGGGAVAAVIYSWIGDVIPAEKRNRAMSIPGMAVGISSTLSFIAGPLLHKVLSVEQIFLLCGGTSLLAVFYIIFFLEKGPDPKPEPFDIKAYLGALKKKNILPIYISALIANYLLISVFFVLPKLFTAFMALDDIWIAFAPATIAGVLVMRLTSKIADSGKTKLMLVLSFLTAVISGSLFFIHNVVFIIIGTILFLCAYMSLVTILPATLTKLVKAEIRGTVMGTLNTLQNLGSFLGGIVTGILWGIEPSVSIGMMMVLSLTGGLLMYSMLKLNGPDSEAQ